MAKLITGNYKFKIRKKRPGIHSKKRNINNKHSLNYVKKYKGQGR